MIILDLLKVLVSCLQLCAYRYHRLCQNATQRALYRRDSLSLIDRLLNRRLEFS